MLPSSQRFHGRNSLRRVFTRGTSRRGRLVHIRVASQPSAPTLVSRSLSPKKVLKSAVKRNHVRRRVFNIVRHELTRLPVPYDIVISVVSADALVVPYVELQHEVQRVLALACTTPERPRPRTQSNY